ncbi:hypothetical protein [Micromonospora sp. U21]|uniref:hypothetical protein n=1 Tax=Micromonospora sp. U21 TaxID=2824899 RepID=UPI001B39352E|nr:hypothetical protein [Micromonospora sp. U21]
MVTGTEILVGSCDELADGVGERATVCAAGTKCVCRASAELGGVAQPLLKGRTVTITAVATAVSSTVERDKASSGRDGHAWRWKIDEARACFG